MPAFEGSSSGCAAATSSGSATGHVRADAAVTINGLVRWTINRGVAGLEAWAGTPGTVGGAIYGNAHFQGRNIGELVDQVSARGRDCRRDRRAGVGDGVRLRLQPAASDARVRRVGRLPRQRTAIPRLCGRSREQSLAFRKRTQPLESASAGCIFQNPDPLARKRARRHSGIGRRAGRSRRAEREPRRHGARLADARQLHRQRGRIDSRRDSHADRSVQARTYASGSASNSERKSSTSDSSELRTLNGFSAYRRWRRLSGKVSVEGNKNSALPLLAACLLDGSGVRARERAADTRCRGAGRADARPGRHGRGRRDNHIEGAVRGRSRPIGPTRSSSANCADRCSCSARCSPGAVRRDSRSRVAISRPAARFPPTCRRSTRWAPSRSTSPVMRSRRRTA